MWLASKKIIAADLYLRIKRKNKSSQVLVMNVHICNENLQVDTSYIVNERFKNIHISFETLDWKALEAFSDITARGNHPRCRNTRTTFLWQHSTATPVLRSAKRAPANVRQLNNISDVIFYCSVGERWRALALLNAALCTQSMGEPTR